MTSYKESDQIGFSGLLVDYSWVGCPFVWKVFTNVELSDEIKAKAYAYLKVIQMTKR